ncbi:VOC family protein [Streptacidiphilus sp. P02-A3a]|uniref:VOC family protein n=1 Tax=Streptacidiphilus sp. P02-A3a TaxID=2704468 RepID=UPI0015F82645|nr:VOC family protein [Streptacidiphilus sp. P02-A3a]QMU73215.1 VOC family protein [Streptacidiphilus sp. P02-A3a]
MTVLLRHLVIECRSPNRMAEFWSSALGRLTRGGGGGISIALADDDAPVSLLFVDGARIDSSKALMWMHMTPAAGTLEQEVARLCTLGATTLKKQHRGWGIGEVTMADPEGNEFFVESGTEDLAGLDARMAAEDRGTASAFWRDAEEVPRSDGAVSGTTTLQIAD